MQVEAGFETVFCLPDILCMVTLVAVQHVDNVGRCARHAVSDLKVFSCTGTGEGLGLLQVFFAYDAFLATFSNT